MKRYSIVATPGTVQYEYQYGTYGRVIATSPSYVNFAPTGRILKLCGRSLMTLDGTKHNGFSWFRIRDDVELADFDITFE